jgi:acetylornithine deacetylase/succinyl-diaminopimelate desuccinylase-like protein
MKTFAEHDAYLAQRMDESIAELARYCEQPTISAQGVGLQVGAELTAEMLRKRGFAVQVFQTGGAPVVFAERAGRSEQTLLFYNHYDVQPAEPLELWDSPPFQPALRDGKLFARGVSDDKGHLVSRLFAIDAILATDGELPCRVKWVVEGEEETSSYHLREFVEQNAGLLKADACVWEFGGVDYADRPVQYLGLRGILYVELRAQTASQDVHSGIGGSIFPNAAWRLVWALNTLKDEDENILLPGFYDPVIPPSERDLDYMAKLPDVAEDYRANYGVQRFLHGLAGGAELRVAEVFQPTCTICGLTSGYQGPGSKTVLPAHASAKIDFRLVPNQRPEQVVQQLRAHLDAHGFADIEIEVLGGEAPARTDTNDPFVQMVVASAEEMYGQPMQVLPITGGSGPNHLFIEHLGGLPVVTSGIGHPGANAHAPNENVRLDLYLKGAQHIVRILKYFGEGYPAN